MTTLQPSALPPCVAINSGSSTVVSGSGTANYVSESGANNTVLGLGSLAACTTGTGNTAVGVDALTSVGGGGNNTGVGYGVLGNANAGIQKCTAVGPLAGATARGSDHTLIGAVAQLDATVNSTVVGETVNSGGVNNCILLGRPLSTTTLVCPLRQYDPRNNDTNLSSLPDGAVFEQTQSRTFSWIYDRLQSTVARVPSVSALNQVFVKLPLSTPVLRSVSLSFTIDSVLDALLDSYQRCFSFTANHTSVAISIDPFNVAALTSLSGGVYVRYQFLLVQGVINSFVNTPPFTTTTSDLANTFPTLVTAYTTASTSSLFRATGSLDERFLQYPQPGVSLSSLVNVGQEYTLLIAFRSEPQLPSVLEVNIPLLQAIVTQRTGPLRLATGTVPVGLGGANASTIASRSR
jgi:hypothetical protein